MSEIMVRRRSQRLSVPETSSPFNGIIDRPVSKVLSPLSPKIQNQNWERQYSGYEVKITVLQNKKV